jgi:hypothetical protein
MQKHKIKSLKFVQALHDTSNFLVNIQSFVRLFLNLSTSSYPFSRTVLLISEICPVSEDLIFCKNAL